LSTPLGGLDRIIDELERQLGSPLADLSRSGKQQAVRLLEEAGAFSYRKSVEAVAASLGVSRFTVYNYLNRERE
jgi:predicted transcriptional regulator YheO